ncbi:cupredoxin domain-containing protein [Candidatus Woesearchaeota archaeon]|nr:cupredoxin domain-containing protein [Candidatus Woesearchaeota archaeon]
MKKLFMALALIFVFISACAPKEDKDAINAKKLIEYHKKKFDSLPLSGKIANGVREIGVKAFQYGWEPESIVVKKGEKVRFIVETADVPHGFELEGIIIPGWDPDKSVRKGWDPDKSVKKGDKTILEINAEEAGVWDMVCTAYCGPGHTGMKGKYIVKN